MNKLPTKQIYLLTIIIVGIITLSVYSTYALFTFESSTSDIVSIHTPKSLHISENIYEYQQITVEPNSVTTTDIDIYNSFEYDVCYSIWYKTIGESVDENKIQIFQKTEELLTSSGVLAGLQNLRVTIVIINDNDKPVKVNLGTIGEKIQTESCSLNLTSDKKVISSTYNNIENFNTTILSNMYELKSEQSNYLTYKEENKTITYNSNDKIYVSKKFNYNEELFTLENPEYLTIQELIDKSYLENSEVYFCKENNNCSILYKITKIDKEEKESETYYNINLYDKLVGYSSGLNGMRKVNEQDYVFYGDNPNNFIYYNCQNKDDTSTCELWSIVGLYYNKVTGKYNAIIIKNDSIGKYSFDSSNDKNLTWNNSSLQKYLNEKYKFINNYDIYMDEYNKNIETLTSLNEDIKLQEEIINSKISLLNLSDYLYTSKCRISKLNELTEECLKNNWLNNNELKQSWTMTRKEQVENVVEENDPTETENNEIEETEEIIEENNIINNYVYSIGNNIFESNTKDLLEVRPVIYLKSRMLLVSGDGTFKNPYIVK